MKISILSITLAAFIVVNVFQLVASYNVLFLFPFGSRSHRHVFEPVANQLTKNGHQATLFSSYKAMGEAIPGVTNIHHEKGQEFLEDPEFSFFNGTIQNISHVVKMMERTSNLAHSFYQHPFIVDLIKQPLHPDTRKPKFDVVVVDMVFNDFALAIAHHLSIPNVLFSPSVLFGVHAWFLDIPFPISYIGMGMLDFNDPMTFMDRVKNSFFAIMFMSMYKFKSLPGQHGVIQQYLPNTPPLEDIVRNVSFVLTNTHFSTHQISPTMPYYVEVGGINCKPAKPLPQDLEEFMQSAKDDGVIYFSLGSFAKGEFMPDDMKSKIIEAFSKVSQKVLWKIEQDLPNLPKNVRLIKWAPQQDLLAHPQLRLFISHGGGLSTTEAAYHGCPILGFPLSADQLGNMGQARKIGFAEYLEFKDFTSQQLLDLINKMVNDKSYREKAAFISTLLKDRPQPPAETAAYWIEYVAKYKGAPFLKSSAKYLNFFQYFLIDIAAVFIAIIALLSFTTYKICKFCCNKLKICQNCCKQTPTKPRKLKKK